MRAPVPAFLLLSVSASLVTSSRMVQGQVAPDGARPGSGYSIRLAYFVPRDRQPTVSFEQKIQVVMALVTSIHHEDLKGKGYQPFGPVLSSRPGSGKIPEVKLVRGEREAAFYNNAPRYNANQQWQRLLPEIRTKVGDPQRQVIVVFAETYDDGPAAQLWPGVIARGAYHNAEGGLAVFSAHLLRDELCATSSERQMSLFFDQTPVPGRRAWGKRLNSPRAEFVEDGIGAVAHELGHALGLPHDRREDDRDLMGNGFRNLRRNFEKTGTGRRVGFSDENARLLMCSRYIASDLRLTDNLPPRVELVSVTPEQEGRTVTIRASDDTGLKAFVLVDQERQSLVAGGKLTGKSQELRVRAPAGGVPGSFQLIVADEGGNQARTRSGPDEDAGG